MVKNESEIKAYNKIERDFSLEYKDLKSSLDNLLILAKNIESPLLRVMKPTILLSIKWKFDYLAKTRESLFLLKTDIDYWTDTLKMLKNLSMQDWFECSQVNKKDDVWLRTKEAFNFMWPRNTKGESFSKFSKMAQLRMSQIISLMDCEEKNIKNWNIFDSGCGPGRYINALLKYNPLKCIGMDSGGDIVDATRKRFADYPNVEIKLGDCSSLPEDDRSCDFVISNGVLHHLPNPMEDLIKEHSRIVKPGGYFFIFIAGEAGLELEIWKFMREFLYDIPLEVLYDVFSEKISDMRLQGMLDHGYGEYQQTNRCSMEQWLSNSFSEIQRVSGIEGMDVTEEIFKDDLYFKYRFGSGNLRYLCRK